MRRCESRRRMDKRRSESSAVKGAVTSMPTAHLISGLPCSGKTKYAIGLRSDANCVLFSLDRWLITSFGRSRWRFLPSRESHALCRTGTRRRGQNEDSLSRHAGECASRSTRSTQRKAASLQLPDRSRDTAGVCRLVRSAFGAGGCRGRSDRPFIDGWVRSVMGDKMNRSVVVALVAFLFGAGFMHAAVQRTPVKGGYVVEHDAEVARQQPGPHDGGGQTIGYSFFSQVPKLGLVFRKRALKPGSGIGYHEQTEDEIYYVLSGSGVMTLDGKDVEVEMGR